MPVTPPRSMPATTSFSDSPVAHCKRATRAARLRNSKTGSQPFLPKIKMDPPGRGGVSGRHDRLEVLPLSTPG